MNFLVIHFNDGENTYYNVANITEFTAHSKGLDITLKNDGELKIIKGDYKSWELI